MANARATTHKKPVACGGPGRVVRRCRTEDGQQIATLRKRTDGVLSAAFSPDGLLVAGSDRLGRIPVCETETGAVFITLRGLVGPVNALARAARPPS